MSITWANERRKLSDLIPWPRNPRQITKDQARRLQESFDQFGQVETIAIGPANEVYNGHQRLNVLAANHGKDYEVEVRMASRALTEKEREKLTVFLHKGAAGEWDWDMLANNFEQEELIEWGFKGWELGIPGGGNDPNAEWKGMPGYDSGKGPLDNGLFVIVRFLSEEDMDEFAKLVGQRVRGVNKGIWYPKHDFDQNARGKKIVDGA